MLKLVNNYMHPKLVISFLKYFILFFFKEVTEIDLIREILNFSIFHINLKLILFLHL